MWDDYRFVQGGFPLSDYKSLAVACVGYLVVVKWLQEYMKQRKKHDLKLVILIHNGFLCILSLVMGISALVGVFNKVLATKGSVVELLLCDPNKELAVGPQVVWFQIFYYSKFYEFLDTVIILLKKRPLIFLHVYHHFITAILMFVMLNSEVAVQWIAMAANCFVHVPMYFYYAVSTMGYNPWWKKYITVFQIVQFVTDITANTIGFYYHFTTDHACSGSLASWSFGQGVLVSFLVLFLNFFSKTYKSKGKEE